MIKNAKIGSINNSVPRSLAQSLYAQQTILMYAEMESSFIPACPPCWASSRGSFALYRDVYPSFMAERWEMRKDKISCWSLLLTIIICKRTSLEALWKHCQGSWATGVCSSVFLPLIETSTDLMEPFITPSQVSLSTSCPIFLCVISSPFGVPLDSTVYLETHKEESNVLHFRKQKQKIHLSAHITLVYLTRDLTGNQGCSSFSCMELTSPLPLCEATLVLGVCYGRSRKCSMIQRYFDLKSLKQSEKRLGGNLWLSHCSEVLWGFQINDKQQANLGAITNPGSWPFFHVSVP